MTSPRFGARVGFAFLAVLFMAVAARGGEDNLAADPPASPLRLVVMDPLSDQLACDCVAGYAQRKYDQLGEFLQQRLGRPVDIAYAESLLLPHAQTRQGIDLVIGKFSEVVADAARVGLGVRTVAMLTGQDGSATLTGLFIVRHEDRAKSIEDLRGYKILFGPEESLEKRSRGLAALEAFGLPIPHDIPESPSCTNAALSVVEEEADAALVSSHAMRLLEGCGVFDKGTLRVVGETDAVPFIAVFATDRVTVERERDIANALAEVGNHPGLLAAIESRHGFLRLPAVSRGPAEPSTGWPDWRGPNRDAISPYVPQKLPAEKRLLWARTLTGPGMSGVAVDAGYVVVSDKSLNQEEDIFRCLDADTGRQVWKLSYRAAGEMDFTNSPRANPVIRGDLVYLLGAFGDLHCLRLESGELVWKRQLLQQFGAKLPSWGTCSTPLIVGQKLIVNPGAKDASIVALDRLTGEVVWATPGYPPGYASFILAELGGVRQIVGYDAISLGGWDPETGKRLWQLLPEWEGDFNVPTPIVVDGKILVSTENNGTRLYGFDRQGRIIPQPLALSEDLAPDTSTPVVLDRLVFGNFGALLCLDLDDGLKTLWEADEDPLTLYCSFIAGNGHVLVTTQEGILYLLRASKQGFDCVGRLDLFSDVPDTEREVWSHPALVGNRLYVRNLLGVYCFLIE